MGLPQSYAKVFVVFRSGLEASTEQPTTLLNRTIGLTSPNAEGPILLNHEWNYLPKELNVEFHNAECIQEVSDYLRQQKLLLLDYNRLEYRYGVLSIKPGRQV